MSTQITDELLYEIRNHYVLDWNGIHGIYHWNRVFENGMRLSVQEGVNIKVVQLFSVFHDSQRLNENSDYYHGSRGAILAGKLRNLCHITDDEFDLLLFACSNHTYEDTHEDITIQVCFDSDRLDLGRVGVIPDPRYLCSPLAKTDQSVIDLAYIRSISPVLPTNLFGMTE